MKQHEAICRSWQKNKNKHEKIRRIKTEVGAQFKMYYKYRLMVRKKGSDMETRKLRSAIL
jgi:hypothetical protein